MGKGGEQSVSNAGGAKKFKLEHMETEVLRKWATAYGITGEKDRKFLLEALVRYDTVAWIRGSGIVSTGNPTDSNQRC